MWPDSIINKNPPQYFLFLKSLRHSDLYNKNGTHLITIPITYLFCIMFMAVYVFCVVAHAVFFTHNLLICLCAAHIIFKYLFIIIILFFKF